MIENHYICTNYVPNFKIMLVISTREFRDKQKSYLERIDKGEEILIRRGKDKTYKILPVTEDDMLMSKEEYFAKLDKSIEQAKEGKVKEFETHDKLKEYLENL